MTTAIDTNVIIALWDKSPALSAAAQRSMDAALDRGSLVISAPVFAELMAAPGREVSFLNEFFDSTGITVDWILPEAVWRAAGRAFQAYAARRSRHRDAGPRRILADFLIGAHAVVHGYALLTLDDRVYRASFPGLKIVEPK